MNFFTLLTQVIRESYKRTHHDVDNRYEISLNRQVLHEFYDNHRDALREAIYELIQSILPGVVVVPRQQQLAPRAAIAPAAAAAAAYPPNQLQPPPPPPLADTTNNRKEWWMSLLQRLIIIIFGIYIIALQEQIKANNKSNDL